MEKPKRTKSKKKKKKKKKKKLPTINNGIASSSETDSATSSRTSSRASSRATTPAIDPTSQPTPTPSESNVMLDQYDAVLTPTPPTYQYDSNTTHNPLKNRRDLLRTPPIQIKNRKIRTPPTPLQITPPPSREYRHTSKSTSQNMSFEKVELDDTPIEAPFAKTLRSPPSNEPSLWLSKIEDEPLKIPTKIEFDPDSDTEDNKEDNKEENKEDQQDRNKTSAMDAMNASISSTNKQHVTQSIHSSITFLLPRLEIASRRSIVEEDFISASALKRLVPMLMRRGSRMSQLLFVKEQAVSIENFELAIQVVDKLEELKKRTKLQCRSIAIWRIMEKEKKELEHQEQQKMEEERRSMEEKKEEEMELIVQYDIGQWVECKLLRWQNKKEKENLTSKNQNDTEQKEIIWYRGQITSKEEERIQSISDVLMKETSLNSSTEESSTNRILSYSVKFSDIRMVRKFEMVGSTDVTGTLKNVFFFSSSKIYSLCHYNNTSCNYRSNTFY